jgi:hypothetical protein
MEEYLRIHHSCHHYAAAYRDTSHKQPIRAAVLRKAASPLKDQKIEQLKQTKVPETVEDGWPDQERLPRAASLCAILVHVEAPVMSQTGRAGYPQVGEAIRLLAEQDENPGLRIIPAQRASDSRFTCFCRKWLSAKTGALKRISN